MSNSVEVRGTDLRYLLTAYLFDHWPATVDELVEALMYHGFRPSWACVEVCVGCAAVGDCTWPGDAVSPRPLPPEPCRAQLQNPPIPPAA